VKYIFTRSSLVARALYRSPTLEKLPKEKPGISIDEDPYRALNT